MWALQQKWVSQDIKTTKNCVESHTLLNITKNRDCYRPRKSLVSSYQSNENNLNKEIDTIDSNWNP